MLETENTVFDSPSSSDVILKLLPYRDLKLLLFMPISKTQNLNYDLDNADLSSGTWVPGFCVHLSVCVMQWEGSGFYPLVQRGPRQKDMKTLNSLYLCLSVSVYRIVEETAA